MEIGMEIGMDMGMEMLVRYIYLACLTGLSVLSRDLEGLGNLTGGAALYPIVLDGTMVTVFRIVS